MSEYLKVKDHINLVRDNKSGSVINIDSSAAQQARERKRLKKQKQQEHEALRADVTQLKSDFDEIKTLLLKLAGDNK